MAVAGTTSAYMAQCLQDLVANDTDLVLVEPSMGDWEALDQPHNSWRDKGIRKSLNNSIRRAKFSFRCSNLVLQLGCCTTRAYQSVFTAWPSRQDNARVVHTDLRKPRTSPT